VKAPIIVSALFGAADHAWLDGLRKAHFPPERNVIAAHLTLFHHLPPSVADELGERLTAETRGRPAPAARISGIRNLGGGTALGIASADLVAIRARLADAFDDLLIPQDRAGWRPHVTIQNKVKPAEAQALQRQMEDRDAGRPVAIVGLASYWYRDGPWERIGVHRFAG
jgi:2'-5' RNA ligase